MSMLLSLTSEEVGRNPQMPPSRSGHFLPVYPHGGMHSCFEETSGFPLFHFLACLSSSNVADMITSLSLRRAQDTLKEAQSSKSESSSSSSLSSSSSSYSSSDTSFCGCLSFLP